METSIQKWGNSLGVRLPKQLADKQSLSEGARVSITESKDGVTIQLIKKKGRTLDEMLKAMKPETLHEAVDWGPSVGKEVW